MNAHFSVINKRGATVAGAMLLINIVAFALSLAKVLGDSSKLWLIPVFTFIILFIISMMIMVSILTAGIDIKDGMVIMPDLDASKGKQPKFKIGRLQDVQLHNGEGEQLNPYTDNLVGARFAFLLDDDTVEIYYPVAITAKQFEKIKEGMLALTDK